MLDIRLVSDSELGSFSWRWPKKIEHFERGYAALVRFEGREFRIRHGISQRTVYGRSRFHSVTWVEIVRWTREWRQTTSSTRGACSA